MVVEVSDLDMLDGDAPVGEDSSRYSHMETPGLTWCLHVGTAGSCTLHWITAVL